MEAKLRMVSSNMPKGKRGPKRAMAKMRQQVEKPREGNEDTPVLKVVTAMEPCALDPEELATRLKKLEATQRLLGTVGAPAVLQELEQAQAIERKKETAAKMSQKAKDLLGQVAALEPQIEEELTQVRRKYRLLHVELSSQLEETERQKEAQ
eukprot:4728493-Amphidinium_carterae.1